MNRIAILTGACLTVAAASAGAQSAHAPSATVARVMNEERYLAADARQGRGVGTAGINEAADYIAGQFARAGLQPGGTDGWFQRIGEGI